MHPSQAGSIRHGQTAFRAWLASQPAAEIKNCELLNGHIVREPPASWLHGIVGARLTALLDRYVRDRRLGLVVDSSAGYELPTGDTVEPDGSFIAADRWAAGPQPGHAEFLRIVPNLVIETKSPATARRDRIEKKRIYQASGVDEYWIVDPQARTVDVFVLRNRRYGRPHRYRATLRSAVLPNLEIDLDDLFEIPL